MNKFTEKSIPLDYFNADDAELLSQETCFKGFFTVNKYRVRHKLYQGGRSEIFEREIFERGDAVVLMPYDPITDQVVLIEQFRVGALNREQSPWLLEFIAGMFGEDESPEQVAIREAKEEANIDIKQEQLQFVSKFLLSPGGATEMAHLFLAKVDVSNLSGVYGLADEHEDILVRVMPRQQAMSLVENGKINNAATIIGLQWLSLNYQTLCSA